MALAPLSRFGPCTLAESIGVGGMGEVYRATDTNLKREVAIKVLPESFAQDAERLEQGPIPIDEALSVAMQIAEELEAAHVRDIVHRDLKPANIKLRPDGAKNTKTLANHGP